MAPLADAVRFIDGQQLDVNFIYRAHEAVAAEAFGCDVDQLVIAIDHAADARLLFGRGEAAVDEGRGNSVAVEPVDLVLHQRDQWRDHNREAVAGDRRKLITKALPSAGRHYAEGVFASDDGVDDSALTGPEGGKPEIGQPFFRINGLRGLRSHDAFSRGEEVGADSFAKL